MSTLYEYLWILGQNWWWFMTSGPYLIEAVIKQVWSGYETWANKYTQPKTRQRASTLLALFGVFAAGFLAFRDEHEKLQQSQIQAQTQAQQTQSQLEQINKQITMMQDTLNGQQGRQIRTMNQLSNFHAEALRLLTADVKKDEYPLWKEKQESLENEMVLWVEENLGTTAKDRLLNTNGFATNAYTYVADFKQRDRLVRLEKITDNILSLIRDEATGVMSAPSQSLPR